MAQGNQLTEEIKNTLSDVEIIKTAFNANFERTCLSKYMRQPPRRGKNADKGISDGLECVGGKPRGFHGAVDRTVAEQEPVGRLLGREVHRIHRWGRTFDGDGYGLHAENAGPIKVFEDGTLTVMFLDGTETECKNEEE